MSIHPKLPVPSVPGFEYFTPVPMGHKTAQHVIPAAKPATGVEALDQMYGYYQPAED